MEVSSTTASYVTRAQVPQQQSQVRVQQAQALVSDGADRENDGDSDDKSSVSATRGQKVNITA